MTTITRKKRTFFFYATCSIFSFMVLSGLFNNNAYGQAPKTSAVLFGSNANIPHQTEPVIIVLQAQFVGGSEQSKNRRQK